MGRSGRGHALVEELRHRVLPAGVDVLPGEVSLGCRDVVALEVAEDVAPRSEDGVVPDAGCVERFEQLGPDGPMSGEIVVHALRLDAQDEGASLGHRSPRWGRWAF